MMPVFTGILLCSALFFVCIVLGDSILKNRNKQSGFSLIEMILVVAIIAILVTVLMPHAVRAIQRTKQRSTMKEINSIATIMTDYLTDHGMVLDQNGTYTVGDVFYSALIPVYVRIMPTTDHWGNAYRIYGRTNCNGLYGISGSTLQDFVIASLGHDDISESGNDYMTNPGSGFFTISGMESFNYDLVVWNGDWIRAPQTRLGRSGS
jgi:prepilin-type N-terminal cleavage/methylation domain-containing protein